MDNLLNSPMTSILALCAGAGTFFGIATSFSKLAFLARFVPPVLFLLAYYLLYQQVPDFPPIGATNKIFYVALFATALGALIDIATPHTSEKRSSSTRHLFAAALVSFGAAFWIGEPRFANADVGFALAFVSLTFGATATLWRLTLIADAAPPKGGVLVAMRLLAVLSAGYAPLALFGASAASAGLCLGFAIGLVVFAIITLLAPSRLGATAILGAGGGLAATLFTVVFISQTTDYLILPLLLVVLAFGEIAGRLAALTGHASPWRVGLCIAVLAAMLIALISGSLFLRHQNPLEI
jgi:hypothetical protein